MDLGRVAVAGHEFSVTRLGEVLPGKEAAFEVALAKGPAGATLAGLNLYAWLEDEAGGQACAPAKGSPEGARLHFHVTPRRDAQSVVRLVLRLRAGSVDERASLPLDGHGHEHAAAPHGGAVAAFRSPEGAVVGHLELKLHDDKGDLELWLAKDAGITAPFDLPVGATVRAVFVDAGNRAVELRARDAARNPDEDGNANVRDGRTNYFVFPGETGADSAWLKGAQFASVVRLSFDVDGREHASEEFMLVPHTHPDGHGHEHE